MLYVNMFEMRAKLSIMKQQWLTPKQPSSYTVTFSGSLVLEHIVYRFSSIDRKRVREWFDNRVGFTARSIATAVSVFRRMTTHA